MRDGQFQEISETDLLKIFAQSLVLTLKILYVPVNKPFFISTLKDNYEDSIRAYVRNF